MAEFTLDDLITTLREAAGVDEGVDLDDVLDVPFEALGYDSLALFNTVNMIERDRSIALPDDVVVEARTPRQLLAAVNLSLTQVG
ncbi:acyl carrier protein [Kitasatospora sp. NPDC059811]|uniref:acyl carrier protein n=1 Tax=Streptomycetaceae TaxID=2062 RepID=UPI0007AF4A18|nr:acyl carrier protein [Streptomyces sp. MJM8645]